MIKDLRLDEPMEMTFEITDADMKILQETLQDINIKECPWFEIQDKYGNKAKYYRETLWIPCNWHTEKENLPQECKSVLICMKDSCGYRVGVSYRTDYNRWEGFGRVNVIAWMPLPEGYSGETELRDYKNKGDDD